MSGHAAAPDQEAAAIGRAQLEARVADLNWHHVIDLGHGIVTPGRAHRFVELERTMPEFEGRSVLDIGAWDGYYSFLAEQRGARRVVALDHYVWGVDLWARNRYWEECKKRGVLPNQSRDESDFWRADLPGRRPFDLAREALDSRVEPVVGDVMSTDLDALGTFDVVLFLGVLYHLREPLTALERLRRLTAGVAVIDNEAIHVPGHADDTLLRFFAADDLGGDYGNWFATSEAALHAMCRAVGFGTVTTVVGPPATVAPPVGFRARSQAALRRLGNTVQPATRYRVVVHASV